MSHQLPGTRHQLFAILFCLAVVQVLLFQTVALAEVPNFNSTPLPGKKAEFFSEEVVFPQHRYAGDVSEYWLTMQERVRTVCTSNKISGTAHIGLLINASGLVVRVDIEESSGNPEQDQLIQKVFDSQKFDPLPEWVKNRAMLFHIDLDFRSAQADDRSNGTGNRTILIDGACPPAATTTPVIKDSAEAAVQQDNQ